MLLVSVRALIFGGFTGFTHLSFWYDQYVEEGELPGGGGAEVLGGKKIVAAPLCRRQMSHGLTWDRIQASAMRRKRITACLKQITAFED